MQRFILLAVAILGLYGATILLVLQTTDTSELKDQYADVVKNSDGRWDVAIVKKRPRDWVSLSQLSSIAVAAVLISEDAAFWSHSGFDWQETYEAFKTNLARGKFARGGSTITQQVVKNVYLSNKKTITRKLMELALALRMERQLPKRKILEIYLNVAEFGDGIFGIRQAAQYYFQKSPRELSAKEGAFLAMLLPSPKKYSVSFRKKELTPYARSAVKRILHKLTAAHRLSAEEMKTEWSEPLSFEALPMVVPVNDDSDDEPFDENLIEEEEIQDDEIKEPTLEVKPYSSTNTASSAR